MSKPKIFVLDTNVVLHDHKAIRKFQENDLVIPIAVIEELDHFKKGNDALAFNARGFVRDLDRMSDRRQFGKDGIQIGKGLGKIRIEVNHPFPDALKECFMDDIQDHRIIATAMWVRDHNPDRFVALVTKDINLRMKAKAAGMEAQDYLTDRVDEEKIEGVAKEVLTVEDVSPEELQKLVKKTGLTFGLLHTYTGYPMVKLAKDMVKAGDLGKIRKVVVQYPQGWLYKLTGKENMQASWRTDPKRSGRAGCMGDIGTHAANLAEFITGLKITEVLADLTIFVKGRKLDDDGNVLFHMEKGAKGVLTASQISPGEENDLHIWVYGEKKALAWYQENPNYLRVFDQEAPEQVWKRGNAYVAAKSPAAGRCTRTPMPG